MIQTRGTALVAALVCAAFLLFGPALAAAQEEDLDDLGDAVGKRGEILEEYGKALRDRLKGKDPSGNIDDAREAEANLDEARDHLAGTGDEAPNTVLETDARRILGNPDAWVGRDVRLEAAVQDVISSRAFTLRTGLSGPGSDLLVLSAAPLPGLRVEGRRWVLDSEKIVLTGRMRLARPAELERELGWDLAPALEEAIDGKLVLVAGSVLGDKSD